MRITTNYGRVLRLRRRRKFEPACQPDTVLARERNKAGKTRLPGWSRRSFEGRHRRHEWMIMRKDVIKVPERGTYKWQLFKQWAEEFRQTQADHVAYIALHVGGVLEPCRTKFDRLMQHHRQQLSDHGKVRRHSRAIERLQNTMSAAAMSYESNFRRH